MPTCTALRKSRKCGLEWDSSHALASVFSSWQWAIPLDTLGLSSWDFLWHQEDPALYNTKISKRTHNGNGDFSLRAGCVWLTRSWVQNVGYISRHVEGHSRNGIICGAPCLFLFDLFCLPILEALTSWVFSPNPRDGSKKAFLNWQLDV